jgi:hypothetical protein
VPAAPAPRRIRLAPEYGCWPTWDDRTGDNLDPHDLALPGDLAARLVAWDGVFQATLDHAYPPDSRFPDAATEAAWTEEGEALTQALREALGTDGLVVRGS